MFIRLVEFSGRCDLLQILHAFLSGTVDRSHCVEVWNVLYCHIFLSRSLGLRT